jgi:hypothetical protein
MYQLMEQIWRSSVEGWSRSVKSTNFWFFAAGQQSGLERFMPAEFALKQEAAISSHLIDSTQKYTCCATTRHTDFID